MYRRVLVDTNLHYQAPYFQPAAPQQPSQPQQPYPADTQPADPTSYGQPWSQPVPTIVNPSEQLNGSTQINSSNASFYPHSTEQSHYIQPGFTSTPNPYASAPGQSWQPAPQADHRERLPSNEVSCLRSNDERFRGFPARG